jgi:hypothetical protein
VAAAVVVVVFLVLYGCETWSSTLSAERRLSVLENGAEENIWT